MDELIQHASLRSQLGNAPCLCVDTEEMFWLREADDYASKVKLGNLLSGQYRFREAVEAYRSAEDIRSNDPMLYLCLGGAYLTLLHFERAKEMYEKCRLLGGSEKSVAYPMGVWYYLQGNYREAAHSFAKVLPCDDEMRIAVLYWNALCCLRGGLPDDLIETYHEDMLVGHHTAYQLAVEAICGKVDVYDVLRQAEQESSDLNAVIALYGVAACLEHCGNAGKANAARDVLLQKESVWPCISYLAAWNDRYGNGGKN